MCVYVYISGSGASPGPPPKPLPGPGVEPQGPEARSPGHPEQFSGSTKLRRIKIKNMCRNIQYCSEAGPQKGWEINKKQNHIIIVHKMCPEGGLGARIAQSK